MAYYEEEDEQQDPNAPAGQQIGSQSGIISGQGSSPGQGSPTPTPDNPGNFVGIKQYLDANKVQSGRLGDQVSNQIQSTIQGANEEIGGLQDKFNQQADKGQIADIHNAVSQAQGITQKAATQTVGQGLSGEDKDRFKEVTTAQYKGPKALIDTDFYQPAYAKMKDAQNYADLSKDESGSQQLLKDIYKSPSYSAGENRLDSYLLNSAENRQKLSDARGNAADNLQSSFDAVNEGAAQYAEQQEALAQSVRQGARQNLANAQTQRNAEVQAGLDAQEADWKSEYDQYVNLLKNSNGGQNLQLTDEQAQKLGVEKGQRIFNLLSGDAGNTPEQYLTMQAFDPNKVISKNEQAQLAALDELAGLYGGAAQNKYTQADLAETLNKSAAFAADKFGTSAKQAQIGFDNAAKTANMISEATASGVITQAQGRTITESIQKSIEKIGGDWWNPVKWFETVTEIVTRVVNVDVPVARAYADAASEGTVAQYLAGQGPQQRTGGYKDLDWGTILGPSSLVSDETDRKIEELQGQLKQQTKDEWTQQILNYLQKAGYNNTVK